jgi:hypothetical protein
LKINTSPLPGVWVGAPEKVVSSFVFARLLESEDECPLWVQSAEHVANDAVFAGGVKRLQYDEKRLIAVRVKQVLQLFHAFDMFEELGCSLFIGLVFTRVRRIDFRQMNLRTRLDREIFPIVHTGFSRYDATCGWSDWLTMSTLLACRAVRSAAKRSVISRTPPNTNIQAMF